MDEIERYEQEYGSVQIEGENYVYVGEERVNPGFEEVVSDRIEQLAVKIDDVEDEQGFVTCYRISSNVDMEGGEDEEHLEWHAAETGLRINLKSGELLE